MNVEKDDADVATFDWTRFESPSAAVVSAVTEETGADPATVEPLYGVVDPDSLDSIFGGTTPSSRAGDRSVEFEYHDCWVVVESSGLGYIYPDRTRRPAR